MFINPFCAKQKQLFYNFLHTFFYYNRHHTVIPLDSGDDRVITMLPMVHIAGLVIGLLNPLAQGATVVILPKFVPEEFLLAVQKYRVSTLIIYTTMYSRIHQTSCNIFLGTFIHFTGNIFPPCSSCGQLPS